MQSASELRGHSSRETDIPGAKKIEQGEPEVGSQGSASHKNDPKGTKYEEAILYVQEGKANDSFLSHPKGRWSKRAYKILHHPVFYVFDLLLCIMLMLLALIEKPAIFAADTYVVTIHGLLEFMILLLIIIFLILRIIWQHPQHFFTHRRSVIITIMLFVMLAEVIAVLIRQQSHVRVTRALRPVLLIDTYLMYRVRRVLRHILQSLKHILDIILHLLFIIALFSVTAYYLFAEMDPDYFETYGLSYVSLFITFTTANNPDVMMETYNKHNASPFFFIAYLIITVYFIANILLAVVYTNFTKQEKDKFQQLFLHKREALYHAFRTLTGPNGIEFDDFLLFMQYYKPRIPEWQVMCEFKALKEDGRQAVKQTDRQTDKQQTVSLTNGRRHDQGQDTVCLEEFYTFFEVQNLKWTKKEKITQEKNKNFFQKIKHKISCLVRWKWFNLIIHTVVLTNTIFLILSIIYIPSLDAPEHIRIAIPLAFVFLLVYIVENILKIIALGPYNYFTKFWNKFDFVLLSLSLIALCLEIKWHFLVILRPIKLIRLVHLKKRYRNITNTIIILIPQLLSVAILLLVIYYFFAIIGMEFLADKVHQGCCVNASYDVGEYFSAGRNETSVNAYYLLNFDNLYRSYVTLFTLMVVNNWFIIKEGFASEVKHPWLARIYFMAFYIVTLVVLQVAITYIVDAFVLQLQKNKQLNEVKAHKQRIQQVDNLNSKEKQDSKPEDVKPCEQKRQQRDESDSTEEQNSKPEDGELCEQKREQVDESEQNSKPKEMEVWEQEIQQVDDSDSVEDEYGRKKVQVTLLPEDVRKLKCETRDEKTQSKWFGLDYVIRRWRRIDLEKLPEHYIGQRQRTKDDVYLWQFRSDIKTWTQEQDLAFKKEPHEEPFKERARDQTKKMLVDFLTYLVE